MIGRLVAAALRARAIVLCLTVALVAAGLWSWHVLDIEAYPNPVPPMIEVVTQPNGLSAEEVERFVTVPLEIGLAGMPGLAHTRSQSLFGLSDIKCYFDWGTEYETARQEVINRIGFVSLPHGFQAQLSPWSAVGEIYRYTLSGEGYSLMDLKTAQDWVLERQFRRVPGVIDVTSFGGETRQYHVEVDPYRLQGAGATLDQLTSAIANANENVGGQRMTLGEQSYDVRGIGLLRGEQDIQHIVLAAPHGVPVRVADVGTTSIGPAPRLGLIGIDDRDDVVQGIVLMRHGAQALPTLEGVHDRAARIASERRLPPGVTIRPYYDRGELVRLTVRTVMENVIVGILLVAGVLLLFLGYARAALLTALTIPLALLVAFGGLVGTSTSANLLSIGAIDFGIVVDSSVIMVENIVRHLGPGGRGSIQDRILNAAKEVGTPMTVSTLIIATTFVPLFTMTGVAGVIFGPMARTYAFAIGGAILLALTLLPVLASRVLDADRAEHDSRAMRAAHHLYSPVFRLVTRRPAFFAMLALVPIVLFAVLFPRVGREFMPKLEEGNLWIRVTLPVSISLERASTYVTRMRRIVRGCPVDPNARCTHETQRHPMVRAAVSQIGRPDDGTDVTGFDNVEIFAPLLPFDEWPRGVTKDALVEQLSRELHEAFPGAELNFSQMISDNVEEAVAGVKGENSVRVFGPDLVANETAAHAIVAEMSQVRGITDLGMFHTLGQPDLRITPDRAAAARYGLNTGDIDDVIEAAIGGQAVTQVYEGDKRFDLTVRWQPAYRNSIDAVRAITIATPDGGRVPLGQIARVELTVGPRNVYREDGERYSAVKFSVRGRDLASAISEAQHRVARAVRLPYGSHLEWSGEMSELAEAEHRLAIVIPLTLLLIVALTFGAVRSWIDTVIVVLAVPTAAFGGLVALLVTGTHFSVSAAMGLVSVFGVAIQDAILLVTYFQRLRAPTDGSAAPSVEEAAREAAEKRLRAALVTTLVAMLGLLPAALSHGIGAQTQRPLALVVIGGALSLTLVNRAVLPALIVVAHRWRERRRKPTAAREPTVGVAVQPAPA